MWRNIWKNLPESTGFAPDVLCQADDIDCEIMRLKKRIKELRAEYPAIAKKAFELLEEDWTKDEIFNAMLAAGTRFCMTWPWVKFSQMINDDSIIK